MKLFKIITVVATLLTTINAGKFDGIFLGASIGGNLASLKETSIKDGFSRWGANGKIFGGICKSLADVLFVGVEVYGRYSFFVKTEENTKGDVEGAPQFGGCLKAGLRPSENLLIYGVYGIQGNYTKIKNSLQKFFEPSDGGWSTFFGGGVEYALGLGVAVRLEGVYEPNISFKIKDIPDLSYDASFFSINLGLAAYL
jgi:opacity protein-like surface antigen